jgi:hypothetical protein
MRTNKPKTSGYDNTILKGGTRYDNTIMKDGTTEKKKKGEKLNKMETQSCHCNL